MDFKVVNIMLLLLAFSSTSHGFLVKGWTEEWEYLNATDIEEARPGIRIRITQEGFDTAARLSLDLAMAFLDQIEIPPVQEKIGNADVTISNISVRINRLARPQAEIRAIPGQGIFARVHRVQPKITADYRAVVNWGFFGISEKEGTMVIRGKKLAFSIELFILRNEFNENAPPMLIDTKCSFEGDLSIVFNGGFQDILNFGSAVFGSNAMQLAASEACKQIKLNIMNNMVTDISSLPVNETQDLEFDFNYGMVRFPELNENFVELFHRGTVYYLPDRHEPPFQPEVIPPYWNHTDKMIYIYMSDYVINSASYAGYLSGYMAYNVTPDLMPPEVQNVFRTSCVEPDVCLGTVFKTLSRWYPSSIAGISIYATDNPEIHVFNGTTAQVSAQGEVAFFVDEGPSREFLFTIAFSMYGEVTVGVNESNVNFRINEIHPRMYIASSNIGNIDEGGDFQQVIAVATREFVIPQLTELGAKGFELPKSDEVEFVDPEIIPLEVDGTFVVATDFKLSLPDELIAKGLETFRRHKGCKRPECTTPLPSSNEKEEEGRDVEQPLRRKPEPEWDAADRAFWGESWPYGDDLEYFTSSTAAPSTTTTTTTTPEPTTPRRRNGNRQRPGRRDRERGSSVDQSDASDSSRDRIRREHK